MDRDPHDPQDRADRDEHDGLDAQHESDLEFDAVLAALREVEPPRQEVVELQISAALEAWDDLAVARPQPVNELAAVRRRGSRVNRWSFATRPAWIGAAAALVLVVAAAAVVVVDLGSSPGSDDELATSLSRSFDVTDDTEDGDDADGADDGPSIAGAQPMGAAESMGDTDDADADAPLEMFGLDGADEADPPDVAIDDQLATEATDMAPTAVWLGELDGDELDRVLDQLASDPDIDLAGIDLAGIDLAGIPEEEAVGDPDSGTPCADSLQAFLAATRIDERTVVIGIGVDDVVALDLDTCEAVASRPLVAVDGP